MDTFPRRKQNLPLPGPSGTLHLGCCCPGRAAALGEEAEVLWALSVPGSCWHGAGSGAAREWGENQPWVRSRQSGIAQRFLWAGALPVAPSPCSDPHRGAGAQPCLPHRALDTVPNVPKGKTRGSLRIMRFVSTRTQPIL